jgi:hypothetical protein
MNEIELLNAINEAKDEFAKSCDRGCGKYSGALTVQLIKQALNRHGIQTSERDVFIRGVPIEVDLLIPRNGVVPKYGILYEPEDVLLVFELKNKGVMCTADLERIANIFQKVRTANPDIRCIYLTLSEWIKWKEGVKDGDGFKAFALFWSHGSNFDSTGMWQQALDYIKNTVME